MVDFNNETTVTVDRSKLISIMILERLNSVIESLNKYYTLKYANSSPPTNHVKANIRSLFNITKGTIKLSSKERHNQIKELIHSGDLDNFLEAYEIINDYLVETGLIKFIITRGYDPKNPLEEDEFKGL